MKCKIIMNSQEVELDSELLWKILHDFIMSDAFMNLSDKDADKIDKLQDLFID